MGRQHHPTNMMPAAAHNGGTRRTGQEWKMTATGAQNTVHVFLFYFLLFFQLTKKISFGFQLGCSNETAPECGQHQQHPNNGDDGQQADENGFASMPLAIGVLYYVALKFSIYSNTTIFQLFS